MITSDLLIVLCVSIVFLPQTHAQEECSCNVQILDDYECSRLDFEADDDKVKNSGIVLNVFNGNLHVVLPQNFEFDVIYVRFGFQNASNQTCRRIENNNAIQAESLTFEFLTETDPHKLSFKTENVMKNFALFPPKQHDFFAYVDYTDTSLLRLQVQTLPRTYNVTMYKIRAFKVVHRKKHLEDLRVVSDEEAVSAVLPTYNEEGWYFFTVTALTPANFTRIWTPSIFIGRKSTRMVVGIVGASFILPFLMFVFHVLTRKCTSNNANKDTLAIVILYRSCSSKHEQVVCAFGKFLSRLPKCHILDIINLNKPGQQNDSLASATHAIYVTSPRNYGDAENAQIDTGNAQFCSVSFSYCVQSEEVKEGPHFVLFDEFEKLLKWFKIEDALLMGNYVDELTELIEDARACSEKLPVVMVTNECESLIGGNVRTEAV